jgi:hypothetical protein
MPLESQPRALNGNLARRLAHKPSELLKSQLQNLLHLLHLLASVRRILSRNPLRSRQLLAHPKCVDGASGTAAASKHAVQHLDL